MVKMMRLCCQTPDFTQTDAQTFIPLYSGTITSERNANLIYLEKECLALPCSSIFQCNRPTSILKPNTHSPRFNPNFILTPSLITLKILVLSKESSRENASVEVPR